MTVKEAIGAEIKDRRLAAGYSRRRFSIAFGISRRTIGELEDGRCNPTIDTLQAYADALEIDLFELFECASRRMRNG